MTYQADQIQSILHDLDRTLRQTGHWKRWNIFARLSQQRRMLERVRDFLMTQSVSSRAKAVPPHHSEPSGSTLGRPVPPPHLHPESIKLELVALNAQRDALREEVKFLEQRKEQYLSDPSLRQPEAPKSNREGLPIAVIDERQVEQLKALSDRTDFLLSSMDSSLQLAFSSMQKNVDVYQTSLHQGLDRMHSLGYQGEVLVSALVNQLAQHLERELGSQPTPAIPQADVNRTSQTLTEDAHCTPYRSTPLLESDPKTISPETLSHEPAVRFSSDTPVLNFDITLENLFGDSDNNSDNHSGHAVEPHSTNHSTHGSTNHAAYDEITLEEMNQLFADVPPLRS